MNYLKKLKEEIRLSHVLHLLQKDKNRENKPTSRTALTVKRPLGTLDSTKSVHILPVGLPKKIFQQQHTHDNCPAKCKQTGQCYGTAYFNQKPEPEKSISCLDDKCPWIGKLESYFLDPKKRY